MADGITIVARNLQFDGKEFSKEMNEEMETLFHEAARAFLIAATRRIPIRTGFLRGAFTRLEDVVGAFEVSSAVKLNRSGVVGKRGGPRPGKDLATSVNRVARLRQRQNNLLRQIRKLQAREGRRRLKFNEKLRNIDAKNEFIRSKKVRALSAANRATALRDRNVARSLIKRAIENERAINRAVQRFKEKIGGQLRADVGDVSRNLRLRDAILQQKRNEAFQSSVRSLNRRYFGGRGRNTTSRVNSTIDAETYTRRLNRLREKIGRKTRTQQNIEKRIEELGVRVLTKTEKAKLAAYAKKLRRKYAKQLEDAANERDELNTGTSTREAFIERSIQQRLRKVARRALAEASEDHQLLAAAQRRLARQQRVDGVTLEHLLQGLQDTQGRLNVTARTSRGRIVGQNSPGKFNLAPGERVKKIFNSHDKEGHLIGNERREYYYPTRGNPETRVLKTPRTGRRFATPAHAIISKAGRPPAPNLALFQQLVGFVKASGVDVRPDVAKAAQDLQSIPTRFEFHFQVDIRYLAINDQRQAWESWQAGINAFSYTINSQATKRLPKLADFQYVVTRQLRPGQSRTISGRK